jgi:glycosyltransferase involved in cell wall biosynthesis
VTMDEVRPHRQSYDCVGAARTADRYRRAGWSQAWSDLDGQEPKSGDSIVFVINSLDQGGAQKQVAEVALRLVARGWQVKGIISLLPLTKRALEIELGGVPVHSVGIQRGRLNLFAVLRLWKLLRKLRPSVLITFLFHASILGSLVGRIAGVDRIIASVRSQQMGGRRRERVFRFSSRLWNATVVNSQAVGNELVDRRLVSGSRYCVIPNGIEIPAEPEHISSALRSKLRVPENMFVWLAVGSLLPAKDYPCLLRAISSLKRSDTLLLVAGDGPLMPVLLRMQEDLQLTDRVRFLGERDDVRDLLRVSDGFVNASAWEGMPNAVMEALVAARPVVATRVGGVPELIEHRHTGWLVPPGNPTALAAMLDEVMTMTAEARTSVGWRGRMSIAERYGWGKVIPMWERLLEGGIMSPTPSAGAIPLREGT